MILGLVDNNVEYCLTIDHDELQKLTENETKSNPDHVLTAWLWFCQNPPKTVNPSLQSVDEKSDINLGSQSKIHLFYQKLDILQKG